MADGLTREQLMQLARLGAEKRLEALRAEIRAIETLVTRAQPGSSSERATGRQRRRPRWSAAKRKAAADRMKAYWANRKAKSAKKK
jgi:hypothetical protein